MADPSPFLTPEFAAAGAHAGLDPRIVIAPAMDGGQAYLAMQPTIRGIARPFASAIADKQGWAGAPAGHDDEALLAVMNAGAFLASNWHPVPQSEAVESFQIDLSDGLENWKQESDGRSHKFFRKLAQRKRKAERELGTVRCEIKQADQPSFDALMEWKIAQYRRSGKLVVLDVPWVQALLQALRIGEGALQPVLASLHIGGQLAAVELGLRYRHVYHSWFPAYNPQLGSYGPGHLLLSSLTERLHEDGVTHIDLGHGAGDYKSAYANRTELRGAYDVLGSGWAGARIKMGRAMVAAIPLERPRAHIGKLHSRWAFTAAFEPKLLPRLALMGHALRARLGLPSPFADERETGQAGRRLANAAANVPSSR